jgi:hypothetical protein
MRIQFSKTHGRHGGLMAKQLAPWFRWDVGGLVVKDVTGSTIGTPGEGTRYAMDEMININHPIINHSEEAKCRSLSEHTRVE